MVYRSATFLLFYFHSTIVKSLSPDSKVLMRRSLKMVYQSTNELSIRTSGTNCKVTLTNDDHLLIVRLVRHFHFASNQNP